MSFDREQTSEHCRQLVAEADRDRYLSSLLAPVERQADLWALYAFNVSIASIRDEVSDPQIGEMRLQWWQDSIERAFAGSTPEHPVLQSLIDVVFRSDLPLHAFRNMIEARRFDLYDDPMPTLNDLEGYLGETSSMIMQLAGRILAGEAAFEAAEASGLAGVAYGLTGLLRSLPIHCSRGQCFMPLDVLATCELTSAHLLSRRRSVQTDLLLSKIRHKAHERLNQARELQSSVPVSALAAYLPASLAELYLNKLAAGKSNPLQTTATASQLRCQVKLWWMHRNETF